MIVIMYVKYVKFANVRLINIKVAKLQFMSELISDNE